MTIGYRPDQHVSEKMVELATLLIINVLTKEFIMFKLKQVTTFMLQMGKEKEIEDYLIFYFLSKFFPHNLIKKILRHLL